MAVIGRVGSVSKEIKDINAPSRWNMRIWDDDNKEWLCQSDGDNLTYYGFDITGGEVTEFQGLPKWHPDRHLIWEQSTGLKDKNGKEIYEGDRIKIEGSDTIYTVEYGRGVWTARFGDESGDNICLFHYVQKDMVLYAEVIGNVYENPELLEGEE